MSAVLVYCKWTLNQDDDDDDDTTADDPPPSLSTTSAEFSQFQSATVDDVVTVTTAVFQHIADRVTQSRVVAPFLAEQTNRILAWPGSRNRKSIFRHGTDRCSLVSTDFQPARGVKAIGVACDVTAALTSSIACFRDFSLFSGPTTPPRLPG